ncbi:MAG: sugar phosphate isomerase/epimerase [Verrucomicrobia bacterium]|nr:MAG: sugar phosphate isomerase/epimerase [Verrucomicrobiota bacterium]
MNRRQFIQTTAVAGIATTVLPSNPLLALDSAKGVNWPIGCFNRPWVGDKKNWGFDAALDGIKEAGYTLTGLLTRSAKEPFIGSDATPEYLAALKKKIAEHGLKVNMAALRTKNDLPLEDQISDVRRQIDNGKTVGVEFLLTFGVDNAAHLKNYLKLMQHAAAYAQERAMKLVLKPHGGESGGAEEIIRVLEQVNHPNFKIWFDAGNIIYYTGRDPADQLKPIARHVTGFCAKDCDRQKGSVWLEFGKGKVDFPAVFAVLKKAGFNGPVMVECCAPGETPEIVTANARTNRQFLEKLFASH